METIPVLIFHIEVKWESISRKIHTGHIYMFKYDPSKLMGERSSLEYYVCERESNEGENLGLGQVTNGI